MKKLNGYVCDGSSCGKFFRSDDPIIGHGKKRILHFCSLKCKATWLKKGTFYTSDSLNR